MSRTYSIVMKTLMGKKYGHLTFCESENKLTGILDILGHQNTISGLQLPDGQCCFSGKLVTPIRNIAFSAEGEANTSGVNLILHTDKNTMPVSGKIETEDSEGR